MKNLAKKGGFIWLMLAMLPTASLINVIGKAINLDSNIIVGLQLPSLALQLFSLFMLIRYRREIF